MAQPFTLELLDGPTWIIDPPFDPYGDGCVQRARVEIRADGLAAHTIATLDSTTPQTLAEFFGQLDADWSARVVFTLEAGEQLRIVARDLASLLAE